MKSFRCLAVAATVLTVVPAGCGDDMMDSGFSSMPNSGGSEAPMTEGSSGTMGAPTTSGTSGTGSAEGESSGEPQGTSTSTSAGSTTDVGESSGAPDPTNTTNQPACNNGMLDPNEQCDGANLNGFTCESLGNTGGTLLCDPVTCTFDTSMCSNDTSGGTSG